MKLSLERITASGNFIPEIDGLRFVAILSVVLFHLNCFLVVKDTNKYIDTLDYSFLVHLLSHGHLGVPLFFIISGLVLGLPFAKYRLTKGSEVSIKKYFLRRITRLEPPYILVMTTLLFAVVFVAKKLSLEEGIKSYVSSLFYVHNIIYGFTLPKLNVVAWSLEIEIQFYILAPLIAYIFCIKSLVMRRLSLVFAIVLCLVINHFQFCVLPFECLINYIQYFLMGFLCADLYALNSPSPFPKTKFDNLIGVCLFMVIWLFDSFDFSTNVAKFMWELVQLTSVFLFYYYVLFHKIFRFLSLKLITNIGGMCYSIYLLHLAVISLFGNYILKYAFSKYAFINVSIYVFILLFLVLLVSSLFFLLVERPCMDQNWYKFLFKQPKKPNVPNID